MTERTMPAGIALRIESLGAWKRAALCAVLGALAGLGQAPFGFWPLTLLALAAFFGICTLQWTARQAAWLGLAAGTGYFLVALNWIVEPFLVDVATHGWMAPFALVLLSAGLGLFWMLGVWAARWLGGGAMAWVAALTLTEALRGVIFTGFPWAQIGHIWIGTPMMQWAAIGGPLLLCALSLGAAAALWHAVAGQRVRGGVALVALAAAYAAGPNLGTPVPMPQGAPIVRLVQPNAAQHEKWDPDKIQGFFDRQIAYTSAGDPPDLVVWPETAVPVLLNHAGDTLGHIAAAARGAPAIVGLQRMQGMRFFNTLALIAPDGTVSASYDKHHLVPFGEYLPFGDTLARFGLRGFAARQGNGYSSGPGPQLVEVPGLGRALPLICYEGVFPRNIAGAPERPDFLLLITNDAWFGELSGPYQHLAQARLRSVEQGLPMIRVANTGVSALIDARGQIIGEIPLGQAGWLDVALPRAAPPTPYARLGDWPVLALMLLIAALAAQRHRFARQSAQNA
nr:apolipoprotein N-acyltransferase [Roseovarius sp. ZX-A-9]